MELRLLQPPMACQQELNLPELITLGRASAESHQGPFPCTCQSSHVSDAGSVWLCLSPWQVSDEQSGKTKPRRYIFPSTPVPATGEGSKHWEALMSERFFFSSKEFKVVLRLILP